MILNKNFLTFLSLKKNLCHNRFYKKILTKVNKIRCKNTKLNKINKIKNDKKDSNDFYKVYKI